ncbi:MAG: DUF4405 domain-containing protein [Aquabacterium sp.]|uniref:cytochrome b/b6 domain-containing protein n=1 Tax=Aquabacterium sp. TaxID=1872578 RepID=UPI0025C2CEEF|nr:cytochrome b/b6 domain-containing protein [Aquabacterium sp.]MBI5924076.1 DUF4405 domain-containing protein [Aquabacterium sp.]
MQISREWATPLTIGAFILMACTGILMFFHADLGLHKEVHEWLGWIMVAGVVAHALANFSVFKRYFAKPAALAIIGSFVVILLGSAFIQEEENGKGGNPGRRATTAVLNAPISDIAPLAGQSAQAMLADLQKAGFKIDSPSQTLISVTGPEQSNQFKALAVIFH